MYLLFIFFTTQAGALVRKFNVPKPCRGGGGIVWEIVVYTCTHFRALSLYRLRRGKEQIT